MKRKNLIIAFALIFGVFCLSVFCFADDAQKEKGDKSHKNIRIYADELIPAILQCTPGTTVTWVNFSMRVQAEIRFLDKKVNSAADCPTNFFIGGHGTYESHKVCMGCTASLCFQEKGTYRYIVRETKTFFPGSSHKELQGTINVE